MTKDSTRDRAQGSPRDFKGYGQTPPEARWPGGARIAINFNLNYEAGGERNVLEGDDSSEGLLTDTGFPAVAGMRSVHSEGSFEYGSRVGVWRCYRIFERFGIKLSVLGVVQALLHNPAVATAFVAAGHEIVSHGWRWIDYQHMAEDEERRHIARAMEGIERLTGSRPKGWMTGRPGPNTRRLLVEAGGLLYDRDALNDELPYWVEIGGRSHLVIPYSYETNDNRFDEHRGFVTADDFFCYLRDAFDLLYAEGAERPKLLSIGLHDRIIGRPARAPGLIRFLEYACAKERVWFARGIDIAEHWRKLYPPPITPA
jgi:peptidoglycan/xylan/chitin deacetylase (PgdA/CDA1 family)